MSSGIYSTSKLLQHPEALARMARGEHQPAPIMVDFMPMLACNQSCQWCAYGHRKLDDPPSRRGWKNMALMSDAYMPAEKMAESVICWASMGVKAVELTGGGEPLIYPHVDEFLRLMAATEMELGLVTNGTALTDARADLVAATRWTWARVSIDAGRREHYTAARRVDRSHWDKAWAAVRLLADLAEWQRVGVGFVVDNGNADSIYEAARLALDHGADNIRVTLAFSPHGLDLFDEGVLESARAQALSAARDFGPQGLDVHDLIQERSCNLASPRQDYDYCGMKDIRVVVGGDQNVYTCCSLAFNPKGLIGSIADTTFRGLWESEPTKRWMRSHDPRQFCQVECLYEQRNKAILGMLEGARAPHGVFV